MGDVTLAGRPYYVVGVTDILLDRWSVEFEGIGPEGLLIVVSRLFDAPVGQWEVAATGERTDELTNAAVAYAQGWLSDNE